MGCSSLTVLGLGSRVQGFRFRVGGLGFRLQGLGFVWGLGVLSAAFHPEGTRPYNKMVYMHGLLASALVT